MIEVTNIKCNKKGRDYYATVKDQRLRYILDDSGDKVLVYTKDYAIGAFFLSRFGGCLSPEGIKKLHN